MQQWLLHLDQDATRARVEEALETARIYKHFGFVRREVRTTPNYEPRYHGSTNKMNKPTEDVVVWNVDTEERMKETYEAVERAVKRLPAKQREIISKKYLDEPEEVYDFNVCQEVHLSERTYRRVKTKAIFNLAFALRLEVWEETQKVAAN
jgi:ArpU family phage transcriptional regulator